MQVSLISFLFESLQEVVALVSVSKLTANDLADLLHSTISMIQTCDFVMIAVLFDNNQINAKNFQVLCGGGLEKRRECSIPSFLIKCFFFLTQYT